MMKFKYVIFLWQKKIFRMVTIVRYVISICYCSPTVVRTINYPWKLTNIAAKYYRKILFVCPGNNMLVTNK